MMIVVTMMAGGQIQDLVTQSLTATLDAVMTLLVSKIRLSRVKTCSNEACQCYMDEDRRLLHIQDDFEYQAGTITLLMAK